MMYDRKFAVTLLLGCFVFALTACGEDLDEIEPNDETNQTNSTNTNDGNSDNDGNDGNSDNDGNDGNSDNDGNDGNSDNDGNDGNSDSPVPGVDPSWVGGHSVENRPILVEHYGESGPILLFVSAIHGQERLAVFYGERFRTSLNAGYAEDHGIQVVFMQVVNPDGTAVYERYNTNGIDLNRNFDTQNFEAGVLAGDEPLSEPETVAITDAVDASNLTAALTLHCCAPTFDPDGPADELAETMSQAMDAEYRFPAYPLGAASGSMGSYVGLDLNLPIVTVEFAGSLDMDPLIQMAQMDLAVDAAGWWTSENPRTDTIDFDSMTTEDDWNYRSSYAGESAQGLPLRLESTGEANGESFVLLSGFDGSSYLGPWIAEHIRRELLAVPYLDTPLWHIMTAVNPDGLADGSATNGDGVDIAEAIIAEDDSSAETAAVLELLSDGTPTVFLVTSSHDSTDRVEVVGPDSDSLSDHIPSRFDESIDPDDLELAEALASRGHTVVQIMVGTENTEAQLEPGNWVDFDDSLNSPFDFSQMVFDMTY